MRSLYAASAATALALFFAACGGSSDSGSSDTSSGGSGGSGMNSKDAGQSGGEGETIFASNCGSCHTLSAAGTAGAVGPNLDELQPSKALVVTTVTNGKGAMPSFSSSLSSAEINEVATYVSTNAGQ